MESLGFRLFLFFFLADAALFAFIVTPEEGYQAPAVVSIAEQPSADILPTAPSPTARRKRFTDTLPGRQTDKKEPPFVRPALQQDR